MIDVIITTGPKYTDKFLAITKADISSLGWETNVKYESYYFKMTPWNLIDLHNNKKKLNLNIIYDPNIEPILANLRTEVKIYQDAKKYQTMPMDEINQIWEEMGFPELFPKIKADDHQKRMTLWMLQVKRGGCYMEQGTGKTPTGLFIAGYLIKKNLVEKPLIVAPVSLLNDTVWFKDLRDFTDFKYNNLRNIEDFYNPTGEISFINPEKFNFWCYKKTKTAEHHYDKQNYFELWKPDLIFFDESACLRNPSSYKTAGFLQIAKYPKYLGLASGLPAPNKILQIWAQMFCLGSVLGDSYDAFNIKFGVKREAGPKIIYFPAPNVEFEIRKRIDLVTYWIKKSDVLKLPPMHSGKDYDVFVDLHPEHLRLYNNIRDNYISVCSGYDENGNQLDGKAIVQHKMALKMKLLQILDGWTNIEDDNGVVSEVELPWNNKSAALEKTIQETLDADPNNNLIVWCRFRKEIETFYKKYADIATYVYGGMSDGKRNKNLKRWLEDPTCRVIFAIPAAVKYGHTWNKANFTFWYSIGDDYEDWAQGRDRNYRRGQTREVTERRFITMKTVEKKMWQGLIMKQDTDRFLKNWLMDDK